MFSNPAENFATERFIAEPGELEVQIAAVKARNYEKDGVLESYIVGFTFRVNEGENKGEILQYDCWVGTEDEPRKDGISNLMKPVLAACGVTPGEKGADEQFRNTFGHLDLGFNPAENTFNSGWDSIREQVIRITVGKKLGKDGKMYQTFGQFAPR